MAWGGSVFILGGWYGIYHVREYRTRSREWEDESKWPQLGGKGRVWDHNVLSTTVSLDLASGPGAGWLEGGRLNTPRFSLALVTVGAAGRERLYALGGADYSKILDTVERWEEGGRRWEEEEERMPERRAWMGAVAVTEGMVCG